LAVGKKRKTEKTERGPRELREEASKPLNFGKKGVESEPLKRRIRKPKVSVSVIVISLP